MPSIGLTVALNQEEMGKSPERITKIKPFINKYKKEGINFPSEKDDWKEFEKNNVKITLMLKKKKYILLMFQNITQTMKNKLFF